MTLSLPSCLSCTLIGLRHETEPVLTDVRVAREPIWSDESETRSEKHIPNWTLQPKVQKLAVNPTVVLLPEDFVFLPTSKMVNCSKLVTFSKLVKSTGIVNQIEANKGFVDRSRYKWWRRIFLGYLVLSVIVAIGSIPASLAFDEVVVPYKGLLFGQLESAFIVIFAHALLVMLTTALGWYSYRQRGHKTLVTYTIFLATLFMLDILCMVYSLAMRHEIRIHLLHSMTQGIHKYGGTIDVKMKDYWDNVQKKFRCCGMFEHDDWTHSDITNDSLPDSCCKTVSLGCGLNQRHHPDPNIIHSISCYPPFFEWLGVYTYALIGLAAWLALWQIIGVFISYRLSKIIKHIPKTERMLKREGCC